MKTLPAAAALLLAGSMMTTACSRPDVANQTSANDTLVTDETGNADALDANLAGPDASLNGTDLDANSAAPASGNAL